MKKRKLKHREKGFKAAHDKLLHRHRKAIGDVPDGECFEFEKHGRFIAYNPHDVRTYDSRGHWLDPLTGIVESEPGEVLAMFGEEGGTTMSGSDEQSGAMLALVNME